MKNEKVTSPTGAFAIEGKVLVPIMEKAPATGEAAAGSVRAYIASLGYEDGQLHTVITFTSNKVACICFRKWSKVPALVIVKSEGAISYAEVEL